LKAMGWRSSPPTMVIDKRDEPLPRRWAPSVIGHFVKQVDCPWHVSSRYAKRLLRACRGAAPYRWCAVEVDASPCRPQRGPEVTKPRERDAAPAVGAQRRSMREKRVGLERRRATAHVEVTELVDKAPPMTDDGGNEAYYKSDRQ
jgi:hypothetical protein